MWKFQHAGGQREINTLHVPIGTPIKLIVSSQDVIHSFFVPAFRLHFDVLPGRFRTTWFEATEVGTFDLLCSQYCGTQHSKMRGQIVVETPDDYQKWLESIPEGSIGSDGEKLFRQLSCNSCHTGDQSARGPMLQGLFGSTVHLETGQDVVADENYIRESIIEPEAKIVAGFRPIMPTFTGQLDEEKLIALITYIRSLNDGREQLPMLSDPKGPQPSPVEGAIKQSRSNAANVEAMAK
jgi:cytochrome c oxidase subunit 2